MRIDRADGAEAYITKSKGLVLRALGLSMVDLDGGAEEQDPTGWQQNEGETDVGNEATNDEDGGGGSPVN